MEVILAQKIKNKKPVFLPLKQAQISQGKVSV